MQKYLGYPRRNIMDMLPKKDYNYYKGYQYKGINVTPAGISYTEHIDNQCRYKKHKEQQ